MLFQNFGMLIQVDFCLIVVSKLHMWFQNYICCFETTLKMWKRHITMQKKSVINHAMLFRINKKRIDNVSCRFKNQPCGFWKRDVNNVEKNGFRHSQCVVSKQHVGLYVESKLTNVELKLLLQLLLCGFDICLFLFDRTAKIDLTEVTTCRGSFGGFKSTCSQLDRAARIKTTGISYFSCNRSIVISANSFDQLFVVSNRHFAIIVTYSAFIIYTLAHVGQHLFIINIVIQACKASRYFFVISSAQIVQAFLVMCIAK